MRISSKVGAFTLLELLVVMVIGGILLGIVYYALQVTQFSYNSFASQTNKVIGLKTLVTTMQNDLKSARIVTASSDRIYCHIPGNPIEYQFTSKEIMRIMKGETDAFSYELVDVSFYFFGKPLSPFNDEIDSIVMSYKISGEIVTFEISRPPSYYDKFLNRMNKDF